MSTKIKWTVGIILMAASLAFTGCGKKSPPPQAPAPNGVTVDMPKLRQEFAKGTPDQQNLVSQVGMGIRYGDHISSLAALDKLVNSPGITD
jgi:predicted small lipoprotein YifL